MNHIYTNNKSKLSRLYLYICTHEHTIITIVIGKEKPSNFKFGGSHMEEVWLRGWRKGAGTVIKF